MEFGYPGSNTHLENHGVSEESFWPSFTDIMMVIVMVFLLVTVAVILNNWSLIGDLKSSIEAQKVASNLAENRLVENDSLGSKLSTLEKQNVILNEKYEAEKANQVSTKKSLTEKQQALIDTQAKLSQTQQLITESKELLSHKEAELVELQTDLIAVIKQKEGLAELNKSQNNTLAENEKAQQNLRQELNASKSNITTLEDQQTAKDKEISELKEADKIKSQVLASLQTDRSKLEKAVISLKSDIAKSQEATKSEAVLTQEIKSKLEVLTKAQKQKEDSLIAATNSEKMIQDALKAEQTALKESEEEKQRIIVAMNEKLIESDEKVTSLETSLSDMTQKTKAKDTELLALKDNSQLRSLQGKYDSLDAKYQKLLRPARSSKGKFIVSVSYKKIGNKRVIRLKQSPIGSYKTVTKKELHKALAKLKAKHKTNLYMKVIIPETSGLSYSEAWKFTSNLQKRYDYYHQPDKNK